MSKNDQTIEAALKSFILEVVGKEKPRAYLYAASYAMGFGQCAGNQSQVARALGLSPQAFSKKIKQASELIESIKTSS